ncbi:hypothetical protein OOK58_00925 [Streptomyces sp. NBC_01728]|uniref:hypothetical protein n=1 Tax=unclassified Streptomyces TaxID=2593676 RepID=UPI0022535A06|nr:MULTISPECIES: hypothetical protein [unclassified Streptomyces]MCX4461278.1 hypothetical protein [Streptomyces sp. NBC_01719]MCX4490186.1 hypothetical protein [Streptomyces sp. NBC_01728]MCX4597001.1 hypothetical protein [Streptomyces sp. NBC_01549]
MNISGRRYWISLTDSRGETPVALDDLVERGRRKDQSLWRRYLASLLDVNLVKEGPPATKVRHAERTATPAPRQGSETDNRAKVLHARVSKISRATEVRHTDQPEDPAEGWSDKSANRTRILIASIGTLAGIAAAATGSFLAQNGESAAPPASVSPPVSSSAGTDDPCDLHRLADSWNQPPSQRYNETLFGNREAPRVYTQVGGPAGNPEISVKGQLSLDIPAGQVLYLITRPDPDSKDEYGHPGNGHFYPGAPISPTSSGCWEDDNHSVGYPGVEGISVNYLLVLVGSDEAAKFPVDSKAKNWDGYSAVDWQAITKIDVMEFHVSTA